MQVTETDNTSDDLGSDNIERDKVVFDSKSKRLEDRVEEERREIRRI